LEIEFQGEVEAMPRVSYPAVFLDKGDAPGQFSEKVKNDIKKGMSDDDDDDDDEEFYDEEYI
jgi:hypothetical protein